jgi:RHS repeat-associated protein
MTPLFSTYTTVVFYPRQRDSEEFYRFGADGNMRLYSYDRLFYSLYGYDGGTTRTYKYSFDLNPNWVNGRLENVSFNPHTAMFYPNSYLNFNNDGHYTKHYYNGMERIASRLGDQNLPIHTHDSELQDRKDWQDSLIRKNIVEITGYEFLEPGEEQTLEDPKPVFELPQVGMTGLQPIGGGDVFYYHPNHLGSTCYVTDENATVQQGFLYAPFGEITNEHNSSFGNGVIPKYSFNAKELDEETGMYYYEARYYAPPVFVSRDRLFEKYPFMSPYGYCMNNPIKYIDPSGDSVAILLAGNAVRGLGHMAILIQKKVGDTYKWFLYSKNGDDDGNLKQVSGRVRGTTDDIGYGGEKEYGFNSVQEFLNNSTENTEKHDGEGGTYYTKAYILPTTHEQDSKIVKGMEKKLNEDYNFFFNNCSQAVTYALKKADVKLFSPPVGDPMSVLYQPAIYVGKGTVPFITFEKIRMINPGQQTLFPK